MGLKDVFKSGAVGVLPAVASGALGDENRGFALGLAPGLLYRNRQRKKDAAGREVEVPAEAAPGMKKGGKVKSSASKRADGIAQRGKTKGRII